MSIETMLILAVDGIANGAIYVLIALGIVLIFSVTRVIFIPFGDIAAFTALSLAAIQMNQVPGTVWLIAFLAAAATLIEAIRLVRAGQPEKILPFAAIYFVLPVLPAAFVYFFVGADWPPLVEVALAFFLVLPLGPLLYRLAYRPIADAPVLVLLIVSVALHFALAGMGLLFFGPEGFRTEPFTRAFLNLGGVIVSVQAILVVAASVLFSILLFVFFNRTLTGKALRATAVNQVGARIVGIRPSRTSGIAFLLASGLGAAAGILIGPITSIYYDSGFLFGLKAFVGAIVGGLISYPLTAVGAILVGLLESYVSFWNSAFKEVIIFGLLIPVLLWRSFGSPDEDDHEEEE